MSTAENDAETEMFRREGDAFRSGGQTYDHGRTFCVGNAVKYVWRAHEKNGLEDYRKAAFYLDDAIRHADPVYATNIPDRTHALLTVVAHAETDPNRSRFFRSIADTRLTDAQEAVTALTA